jgi:hypothetical protein
MVMENFDSAADGKEKENLKETARGNDIVQDAPDPRGDIMPEIEEEGCYFFRH